MTVVHGLDLSFLHNQNGMTKSDMLQCSTAATNLNEVIIFRSTGPWAKRWIERGYPTKNFHVKGKSSDWGPHAGLVPYDGTYSKVGYDREKAKKGTEANDDGIRSGFAGKATLVALHGVDWARRQLSGLVAQAHALLEPYGEDAAVLKACASFIADRKS